MRTALIRGGAILALVFLVFPVLVGSAPAVPAGDTALRQQIRELQVELEIVAAALQADPGDPHTGEAIREAAASLRGRLVTVKRLVEAPEGAASPAEARFSARAELEALEDRFRQLNLAAPRALRVHLRPSDPGPAGPAATGAISGTVTDNASVPLSGIDVDVYDHYGWWLNSTVTNASGAYVTPAVLGTGSYYVVASGLGYAPEVYDNVPCSGCVVYEVGTPVQVTDGATTSGIDFALGVGGTLTGTITDAATGAPLAGARASVYNSAGRFAASAEANASGFYSVPGLTSGTYYVTARASGYLTELYDDMPCYTWGTCNVLIGTPISVTAAATTPGIDFALGLGGRISGTVTSSSTGAPLDRVLVQILDTTGTYVTSQYTDASGHYTTGTGGAAGLPTGSYYAHTANQDYYLDEVYDNITCFGHCGLLGARPIGVMVPATTTGIDFALAPGGRISATVTSNATGAPLANVQVAIYDSTGANVTSGSTDASGRYTSSFGLPTGTYYARTLYSPGHIDELYNDIPCSSFCNVTGGTPIHVTAPLASNIAIALAPGGRVSGTIVDASTGQPLANAWVSIHSADGWRASATTNESGVYTTREGVPAGTYYATASGIGYIRERYDDIPCPVSCGQLEGTPISVTAGMTTTGINFALGRGGRFSGTVTSAATGAPLAGVWVDLYTSTGERMRSTLTNAAGVYTTGTGLPTGTYHALALNYGGYVDELYNDIACPAGFCSVTSGTPISVTSPLTTPGIDFALTPGGRISGTVTDGSSGLPIAGVSVRIYNSSGTLLTTADSYGAYTTWMGLPTGTYYAATFNSLGYIDELFDNIPCPGGSCTITAGTPVAVTVGTTTGGISFELRPDLVFRNGFE